MPSTSNIGYVLSSQLKVQVIMKAWELKVGPMVIGGEVLAIQQLL
jgi:hypothetical protein